MKSNQSYRADLWPSSVLPPLWTWSPFRACSDFALLGQSVHTCVVQEPVFPKPKDSDKEVAREPREEEEEETFDLLHSAKSSH